MHDWNLMGAALYKVSEYAQDQADDARNNEISTAFQAIANLLISAASSKSSPLFKILQRRLQGTEGDIHISNVFKKERESYVRLLAILLMWRDRKMTRNKAATIISKREHINWSRHSIWKMIEDIRDIEEHFKTQQGRNDWFLITGEFFGPSGGTTDDDLKSFANDLYKRIAKLAREEDRFRASKEQIEKLFAMEDDDTILEVGI